jgi:peroxiredoxin Q/BCP
VLQPGDQAVDFELLTDTGDTLKLSSLRGNTVVLFFFPRANTSG